MKHFRFAAVATALALLANGSLAQKNITGAQGYLQRAEDMLADRNALGALDQLRALDILSPSQQTASDAELLRAQAMLMLGDEQAPGALARWIEHNPQSPRIAQARLALGNAIFAQGDYAAALAEYSSVSPQNLAAEPKDNMLFHKAYSTLALGDATTAEQIFATIPATGEYAAPRDFCLAYIAFDRGDYAGAYPLFNALRNHRDLGPSACYYLSLIAFAREDYREALSLASYVASLKDVGADYHREALRVSGESAFNLGDTKQAVKYLNAYAAESNNNIPPSAAYILGVVRYRSGDTGAALPMFQKAAGGDDAMAQSANLYLGQCYIKGGDSSAALMAFEKAYRMKFDKAVSEEALYNYAVARTNGARAPFSNSVSLFENFLTLYPDSRYAPAVEKYVLHGYMSDNDYAGALRAINSMKRPSKEALAAKQRALFVLGTRDYSAGRTASALKKFQEAAAVRPGDASIERQTWFWQATCLYDNGSYDTAASLFLRYLRSAPAGDNSALLARYNLAYCAFNSERYNEALADFRKVIADKPDARMKADALNRVADCLYYSGAYAEAAGTYAQACETSPANGDYALYQQAIMKGLMRDNSAKISGLDEMVVRYPNSSLIPAALLEKAETFAAMGKMKESVEAYNSLIRLYPTTATARKGMLQLAIAQAALGDNSAATETYRRVIKSYPTSEEARLAVDDLKRIHAANGTISEFTAFMASVPGAPQINPSELDALSFRAAEADYVNTDNTSKLEKYIADYPQGVHVAQALYYLADAASSTGDDKKALYYADKLLSNHPDASAADDALLIKAEALRSLGKGELALDAYTDLATRAVGSRNAGEARLGQMRTALELRRYAVVIEAADALDDSPEVVYSRAVALAATGHKEKAYAGWESLAKNPSELYGSMSAVALAQALLDDGDVAAAKKTADALINANPPHAYWLARAFIVLSDALRADGNTFEADEYLRTLRENYPGTETDIFEMINKRLN